MKGTVVLNQVKSSLYDGYGNAVEVREDPFGAYTIATSNNSLGSPETDAFGRLRVSNPVTIFDSKQVFDNNPLDFVEDTTAGGSTSYVNAGAKTLMSVSGGSTDRAIRQTKRYFNYQPGKSTLSFITFNMVSGVANVDKKAGMFDDNNGFIFCLSGTTPQFIIRSNVSGSPVDNAVNQSSWNIDPLDGSGPSGITLDLTKTQILIFDFEWLGVGSVRMGFVIDGVVHYAHKFNHANIETSVYLRSPLLPIRYEIQATASSSATSMDAICSTVIVEGGEEITGRPRSASRGGILTVIGNSSAEQIIAIRNRSNYLRAPVFATKVNIMSNTNNAFAWWLVLNPTFTGGNSPAWLSASNSAVEFDTTRNGSWNFDGVILDSGYSSDRVEFAESNLSSRPFLGANIDGSVRDEICLIAISLGNNEDFYGTISWIEQV